jgi:hypothetical protein
VASSRDLDLFLGIPLVLVAAADGYRGDGHPQIESRRLF